MCNLYSVTKPQDAARRLARVASELSENLIQRRTQVGMTLSTGGEIGLTLTRGPC